MKAVLLAAGTSTRLRPLTDHTPKCLLSVAGVPILRRALETLRSVGVEDFVIVTGYLQGMIREAATGWLPPGRVTFVENPVYATTNNAYSLLLARPHADGHEFLLLDGDILFDRPVVEIVVKSPHADCLALRTAPDLTTEEIKCELDAQGRVLAISKEVDVKKAAGESIGIERFSAETSKHLFRTLEDRVNRQQLVNEYYEASFEQMIREGASIYAHDVGNAYCTEIDTARDLEAAEAALLRRVGKVA